MPQIEIRDPRNAEGAKGDGVMFTAVLPDGATQRFLVSREGLEDLERTRDHPADLLPLFYKHLERVRGAVDKALAYKYRTEPEGWLLLDGRILGG